MNHILWAHRAIICSARLSMTSVTRPALGLYRLPSHWTSSQNLITKKPAVAPRRFLYDHRTTHSLSHGRDRAFFWPRTASGGASLGRIRGGTPGGATSGREG